MLAARRISMREDVLPTTTAPAFTAPSASSVTLGHACNNQPVGWVERNDAHHVVASPCWHARMTDYLRNFTAGCGFFFERLSDVQQGDGFRKGSTHPTGFN
jgi:hypothetical protein